ncbi:hypothetical protein RND81_12G095700 [Saponaria officinalis]|uniref:FAR1 domain-containing protein n=1 Tax=Saponaria officinalis TaxID=3572 RepID=A0AAW1H8J1_SAPOF
MGKPHNIVIRLRTHHPNRRYGEQWLMCDRSVKYSNRTKLDGTSSDKPFIGSKKCYCPFKLKGVGQADGTWTLEVRNGFHNHAIRSKDTILDQETKKSILSMTASKISVFNILIELGNNNTNVTAKQVYNIRAREKSKLREDRSSSEQLLKLASERGYRVFHQTMPIKKKVHAS